MSKVICDKKGEFMRRVSIKRMKGFVLIVGIFILFNPILKGFGQDDIFLNAKNDIEKSKQELMKLEKDIVLLEARGDTFAHARVRLNIARYLCNLGVEICESNADVQKRTGLIHPIVAYLSESPGKIRNDMDKMKNLSIPDDDLSKKLVIKDGDFYTKDGDPALLVGPLWGWNNKTATNLIEYGMNFNGVEIGPRYFYFKEDGLEDKVGLDNGMAQHLLKNIILTAEKSREAMDLLFSPHYYPEWFAKKYPELMSHDECAIRVFYCIENDKARDMLKRYLGWVVPLFKDQPSVQMYDMWNEFAYIDACPNRMVLFRKWLNERYGEIAKLNDIWGTGFKGFDEIPVPIKRNEEANWDRDIYLRTGYDTIGVFRERAAYYDWCRFNADAGVDFFKWMKSVIRETDPVTPVHIKQSYCGIVERMMQASFADGIDREKSAEISDIIGIDGCYIMGNNYFDTMLVYDLLKSIAPGKPIFNSESHLTPQKDRLSLDIRRGIFQQFLHGQSATLYFTWASLELYFASGMDLCFYVHPNAFESIAVTSFDIQRLAKEITQFHQQKPEVAVLYSMASLLDKDDTYAREMLNLYRALFFLDAPIGFVTEKQVKKGIIPQGIKLIIVPRANYVEKTTLSALRQFAARGGKIVAIKDSLKYDEHGLPHTFALTDKEVEYIEHRGITEYHTFFDRLYDVSGVTRTVRVMGEDGKPFFSAGIDVPLTMGGHAGLTCPIIKGVEMRAVPFEGGMLIYLINPTNKEAGITVKMKGWDVKYAKDMVQNEDVALSNLKMGPQMVRMIKLTKESEVKNE